MGKLKKMIPGVIMTKRITLQRHLLSLPQHVVYSINKYARYIVSAKLNVVVGIIEPDIPRHIKIKRSCLTSPGTGRDIKPEGEMLQNTLADSIFCGSEKVLTKPIVTI